MRGVMDAASDAVGVEVLREMVSIPSVSGDERCAVEALVRWMESLGYRASIDGAGNAVGELGSAAPGAREVMLLGHIDTVPGAIAVREVDGVLWGRGSVDAKGALCAFVCGAARVAVPDDARVVVVGAVGEETPSSPGASFVRDRRAEPACVLIGEPSGWDRFTIGYKGRLIVEARFEQACGHSAGAAGSVGDRAIEWWNGVKAWSERAGAGGGDAGVFERVQATVQAMETETDGLMDRARLVVGLRLPCGVSPEDAESAIRALTPGGVGVRASGHARAHRSDRSCAPALALAGAIGDAGGRPRAVVKTGTSDMNTLAARWSCPIVAYGPGDSALDHTPEERIEIAEYVRSVGVVAGAVGALVGAGVEGGAGAGVEEGVGWKGR